MSAWFRLTMSFFILVLLLFALAMFFGPESFRQALREDESPVGQLKASDTLDDQLREPAAVSTPGENSGENKGP